LCIANEGKSWPLSCKASRGLHKTTIKTRISSACSGTRTKSPGSRNRLYLVRCWLHAGLEPDKVAQHEEFRCLRTNSHRCIATRQTYVECPRDHESVRRLILLYKCVSISVLFMCLHLLFPNLNNGALVVTDRSCLPDNGNQLEVKGRSKSHYDTNICLTLSLVSTDS
jgi:hypothetical protein